MWNRETLKMRGKQIFQNNYWTCVLAAFIMSTITGLSGISSAGRGASSSVSETTTYYNGGINNIWRHTQKFPGVLSGVGTVYAIMVLVISLVIMLLTILVFNVLIVGGKRFFVLNQTGRPGIGVIGSGFQSGHYGNIVLTMFLKDLFCFLWTCLFIVPGIIKSYEYRMIPYIIAENPGMEWKAAFDISKRMMKGQKMDTFVLDLSFIGWYVLSVFTCGILNIFYVSPYVEATFAELYAFNRMKAYNEGYIR